MRALENQSANRAVTGLFRQPVAATMSRIPEIAEDQIVCMRRRSGCGTQVAQALLPRVLGTAQLTKVPLPSKI